MLHAEYNVPRSLICSISIIFRNALMVKANGHLFPYAIYATGGNIV